MVREDATGTVYYGSTNDNDFNEAMGLLQSGGGELNTGTLRIQFGTNSLNKHYIRAYYTWMDNDHYVFRVVPEGSLIALGYTIFISASGDVYAHFTGQTDVLSSPTFNMDPPDYLWVSGSIGLAGADTNNVSFIKYSSTNVVGTGKTAKSAIALLAGVGGSYICVYENNRSAGSYSGGKLITINSDDSANFTLLGPICDKQSTGVATSAKFTAMNSQKFSAGDYMIGGHRFKHVGGGIFLFGESS